MRCKSVLALTAITAALAISAPALAQHYHGGHWGHYGGHWGHGGWGWGGAAIGGFAAGALVGSALAAPSYYYYDPGYYAPGVNGGPDSSAVAYCQQRYRSYDPASGTYLGYDGVRHPCP
jgi:hypothetical protein